MAAVIVGRGLVWIPDKKLHLKQRKLHRNRPTHCARARNAGRFSGAFAVGRHSVYVRVQVHFVLGVSHVLPGGGGVRAGGCGVVHADNAIVDLLAVHGDL